MVAEAAVELLRNFKRQCNSNSWIPPYDEEGMRRCLQEMTNLHETMSADLRRLRDLVETIDTMPEEAKITMLVQHHTILRYKRCLLAYLDHRAKRVKAVRWEVGPVLDEAHKKNLSTRETEFFDKYDKLVSEYNYEVNNNYDVNMRVDEELRPPKDLYIEVRVLEDIGTFEFESGQVILKKNTTHFLRRKDVEHLIKKGSVRHITH